MKIDPVCGMSVADDSPRRFVFDGTPYFFCSDGCLRKFSAEPAKYLKPSLPPAPEGEADEQVSLTTQSGLALRVRQSAQGAGFRPSLSGEARLVYQGRLGEFRQA